MSTSTSMRPEVVDYAPVRVVPASRQCDVLVASFNWNKATRKGFEPAASRITGTETRPAHLTLPLTVHVDGVVHADMVQVWRIGDCGDFIVTANGTAHSAGGHADCELNEGYDRVVELWRRPNGRLEFRVHAVATS